MIDIHIVSTDPVFSRFLEIEIARSGFSYTLTSDETPWTLFLVDMDHTDRTSFPEKATLLVFSEKEKEQLSSPIVSRATVFFQRPLLLEDFRRVFHDFLSSFNGIGNSAPATTTRRSARFRSKKLTVSMDAKNRTVSIGHSFPVKLSDTEFALFCRLYENQGYPLSAEEVADVIGTSSSNKYNVYICYLRRKLEQGNLRVIRTVRGRGYMLELE